VGGERRKRKRKTFEGREDGKMEVKHFIPIPFQLEHTQRSRTGRERKGK